MKQTLKTIKIIDIAKAVNKSHSIVSHWFNGKNMPSIQDAILIEQKFNIPVYAWGDIKSYVLKHPYKFGSIKILREYNAQNATPKKDTNA